VKKGKKALIEDRDIALMLAAAVLVIGIAKFPM